MTDRGLGQRLAIIMRVIVALALAFLAAASALTPRLPPRTPMTALSSSTPAAAVQPTELPKADEFLREILSSRTNAGKKKDLIRNLQALRSKQMSAELGVNQTYYSMFIDTLLAEVEGVKSNRWAMVKYPIPVPSYRVKLASLGRVIDKVVADDMSADSSSALQNSRRRALSIVLNQLPSVRSIRSMESEADASSRTTSMRDMLNRTPKGLETPTYKVLRPRNAWEVRQYDDFAVCSTYMDVNENGPGSFNALAGYIFGRNQQQEKMAMTTPVISHSANKRRKMSFVMPSRFWASASSLEGAPRPMDGAVLLENSGGGVLQTSTTLAVKWFGGIANAGTVARETEKLLALVRADESVEMMDVDAGAFLMQYNDPFQPPWRRRNEVAVPVKVKA